MIRLICFVAGVLLSAPAFAPRAGAQVVVSPAEVAVSLPAGARGEVTLVVTNEGGSRLALYAVPLPKEGTPEDVGEVLFATEPGALLDPYDLAMTPEGRLFVNRYGGARAYTWELTPELEVLQLFESPRVGHRSQTQGLAWMPPEHAPPGHLEGTLWWLDTVLGCRREHCTVETLFLLEGTLDGTHTGRSVELVTGPGAVTESGLTFDRGMPFGLAYDAGVDLFYYLDWINDALYAIDVNGEVAEGYPVALVDFDSEGGGSLGFLEAGLDASQGADGGQYLDFGVVLPGEQYREARVAVTDRWGRATGAETPLTRLESPDGQGEVIRIMGVLRSRLDPSVMYVTALTGTTGPPTGDWVLAIRAHPLPPRWLRVAPLSLDLAPGETDTLTVKLDTEGLALGTYEGQVALRASDPNGEEVVAVSMVLTVTEGTATEAGPQAEALRLGAPYPNPARGAVTVPLALAQPGAVRVAVYDVLGREVAVLHDGPLGPGEHDFRLDTSALPAGVYVVRASGGGASLTRRVVLAR